MRERLGRIVIGHESVGKPVTADDLGTGGAITVDEGHADAQSHADHHGHAGFRAPGPFANITHGNSSIVADQIALKLVGPDGYVPEPVRPRNPAEAPAG